MYDPVERRVVISRDVVFNESASRTPRVASASIDEEVEEPGHGGQGGICVRGGATALPRSMASAKATMTRRRTSNPERGAGGSNATMAGRAKRSGYLRGSAGAYLDADYDGEPVHYRPVNDVVGPATPPGLAARELDEAEELPFGGARNHPHTPRPRRMHTALEENGTWEMVEPPPSCRPISLKCTR
ncbi:hypothetical protein U9M48_023466 [Paspalum notatum var. saurae]|uniref:Uncharacterized protein n=1 Tax=Paspalum notatum var. saurae TaxID=547442 RepID=A0AAQ3TKI0_PASNO